MRRILMIINNIKLKLAFCFSCLMSLFLSCQQQQQGISDDLSGIYVKKVGDSVSYQLNLINIAPSFPPADTYYYEIIPNSRDSTKLLNDITFGIFKESMVASVPDVVKEDTNLYTLYTGSSQFGFILSPDGSSLKIDINRFSYSKDTYTELTGKYIKYNPKTDKVMYPKYPNYNLYFPDNYYRKWKSKVSIKDFSISKYPSINDFRTPLSKSDELRTYGVVNHFTLGDMNIAFFFARLKHNGKWIEGWVDIGDLDNYFKDETERKKYK